MRASDSLLPARLAYRGWPIVGVIFLSSALTVGPIYTFGLFIDPITYSFGWRRTAIAASLSFAAVGSVASPLMGRLMDRYGARPVMTLSLAVMGTGFILRPLMTQLWHWYVLSFLQYVAFSGSSVLPAGRLVGIWFSRHRGRVMGLATMGNNFGGLTLPLVTGFLLASGDWKSAYLALAGLTFLVALLSVAIVRERPELGQGADAPVTQASEAPPLEGLTPRDALRTGSFYVLAASTMLASFTYSAVLPQVADHLSSRGMATTTVPLAISLLAAFGMAGKFGFGYLSERITARRTMMLSVAGQSVFVVAMVVFPTPPLAWLAVPLYGLFMGGYGALTPLIIQETFGLRHFGSISGLVLIGSVIPFFLGPLLAGASFDLRDSYGPGFVLVAAMFVVAVAMLTQVRTPSIESVGSR